MKAQKTVAKAKDKEEIRSCVTPWPFDNPRSCRASKRQGATKTTTTTTAAVEASGRARRRPKANKKFRSFITPWPFNNHYEEVLEARYEELASHAASEYGTPDNNRTEGPRAVATTTRRRTIGRGGRSARGWEGEGQLTTRVEGGEDDEQQGGGGVNSAAVTYKPPEGLPGIKEAGGDDNDDDDDGSGRGEWQRQEEAKGKEEILILHHALAV